MIGIASYKQQRANKLYLILKDPPLNYPRLTVGYICTFESARFTPSLQKRYQIIIKYPALLADIMSTIAGEEVLHACAHLADLATRCETIASRRDRPARKYSGVVSGQSRSLTGSLSVFAARRKKKNINHGFTYMFTKTVLYELYRYTSNPGRS